MSEQTPHPTSGHRHAAAEQRRLVSPLVVLAVLLPLLTVAALALVRPAAEPATSHGPSSAPLDRASAVCPARLPGADEIGLGSASLASGEVALRVGREDATEQITDGVGTRSERAPVVVHAAGDLAPGLTVSRFGAGSATVCASPAPERWFTGLGASAEHASRLTLINPDRGPAVADVTVWDGTGVVDVPALRGVRVPGGGTASFDLAQVVPSRDALAAKVAVSRGRLAADVVDLIDPLGRARPAREWLPGQSAPAMVSYLAGLGVGAAERVLTVANPGDSEVRVDLQLVSESSEFTPSGLEAITVAPASVEEVDLSSVLRGRTFEGVQAVRVEATGPVTAAVRIRTPRDLALSVAGEQIDSAAAIALPAGERRLVVLGASAPGVVRLQAWDERGEMVVRGRRVELDPATALRLRLPAEAVLAQIDTERTGAVMALEVTSGGLSVLPLSQVQDTSEVPDVRPAQW